MTISVRPTLEDYVGLAEIQAREPAAVGKYSAAFANALHYAALHPPASWGALRKVRLQPLAEVEAEPGPQVLSLAVDPEDLLAVKASLKEEYSGVVQTSFLFRMVLVHYRQRLRADPQAPQEAPPLDGYGLIQQLCRMLASQDPRARDALARIDAIVSSWKEAD